MSGSSNSTASTPSGMPLSALPVQSQPAPADLVFGIFNGQGQFVPQSAIWTGAVSKTGDRLTGLLSCSLVPTDAAHLVNKAYVDVQNQQVSSTVSVLVTQAQSAVTQAQAASSQAAGAATTVIAEQKGVSNGLATLSADGHLVLGGLDCLGVQDGHVLMAMDLPTTDPGLRGVWWNNGGYLCISQGASS